MSSQSVSIRMGQPDWWLLAITAVLVAIGLTMVFSASGIAADHALVTTLSAALKAVRPDRGGIEGAPFWSEMPFLIERLGIPAVYAAPGDISICHTNHERVPLADYHDAILAFAAFIATTCGTLPGEPGQHQGE